MGWVGAILFLVVAIVFVILWLLERKRHTAAKEKVQQLSKYETIVDAEATAQSIISTASTQANEILHSADMAKQEANQNLLNAKHQSEIILSSANTQAKSIVEQANQESGTIVSFAKEQAQQIAGDALAAKEKAKQYEATVVAMRNTIQGYGDEWLKPTYSLLDELADEFGYTEAGQNLKEARAHSAKMVKDGLAATCEYVEQNRKQTAISFVVDAFNGKVDSILSKTKQDNYGKLEQKIKDAFTMVNYNGMAFRNARITEDYLASRLEELRWGVVAQELRAREIEEQRVIRERMREEERARREFERAQKQAQKEEEMLRKAMDKAREQLAQASEEQRAKYESQLAEYEKKLKEAEEKNQRALSMAQQTKRGNVYVISNIGSFGENVYKVGMTRRLNPMDRVHELSDASVPFPFDVHAFIESEDAPALEHDLHQELALMQMNKVNPRKEFFKVSLTDIRSMVEKRGLNVSWTMAADAAEYRETLAIEERIKSDPELKARWEAFAQSVVEEDEDIENKA